MERNLKYSLCKVNEMKKKNSWKSPKQVKLISYIGQQHVTKNATKTLYQLEMEPPACPAIPRYRPIFRPIFLPGLNFNIYFYITSKIS